MSVASAPCCEVRKLVRNVPKVSFTPIWYPVDQYATSRLRAKYVVELLAGDPVWDVELTHDPTADIAVIVQLCSDQTLESVSRNRRQIVVYDVCDRFFATDNIFKTDEGVLHARRRCLEVIDRADVLMAPTMRLRNELADLFPGKPCFYIPESIDYRVSPRPATAVGSRRLVWFGHVTRGNFESARWIIDYLKSHYEYEPVLVTTPNTLSHNFPAYSPFCVPWSVENVQRELSMAELCVVSHAADEPTKSPNRFVAAMMHGVPTLVSGSPACSEILSAAAHDMFAVETPYALGRAVRELSDPDKRRSYVQDVQLEMWRRHSPEVVRRAYVELFERLLPGNDNY
ncbi:glycosyltransferase [Reyranella sp.]|uniref:glycosyltransferase n=1 Tax=Reyranella sp. TaxID=1929291 RepID=UPI003BAA1398